MTGACHYSVALNEERQQKLAQKEAAAEAARKRVADMKAKAEAERASQIAQAEAERLQAHQAMPSSCPGNYDSLSVCYSCSSLMI